MAAPIFNNYDKAGTIIQGIDVKIGDIHNTYGTDTDLLGSCHPEKDPSKNLQLMEDLGRKWRTGADEYKLSKDKRGYVLIISNHFSDEEIKDPNYKKLKRFGAEEDSRKMENLFKKILKFKTRVAHDVSRQELADLLNEFKRECLTGQYHSWFVIVMSHGGLGPNTILMDEAELSEVNLYTDIVYKLIADLENSDHRNIPKVFFVQACQNGQSDHHEEAVPASSLAVDTIDARGLSGNTLICHSTIPYKVSFRHSKEGALFVSAIENVFKTKASSLCLQEMMREVDSQVIEKSGGRQLTSKCEIGVFKKYHFQ